MNRYCSLLNITFEVVMCFLLTQRFNVLAYMNISCRLVSEDLFRKRLSEPKLFLTNTNRILKLNTIYKYTCLTICITNIHITIPIMVIVFGRLNTCSIEHKYIEKETGTEPKSYRNVLKCFAIFNNVAHSLKPGETPSTQYCIYTKGRTFDWIQLKT